MTCVYNTDEYASLINVVRELPNEIGPRLVVADWLDERFESVYAEFIRVQIELKELESPVIRKYTGEDPSTVPDPLVQRYDKLKIRERELWGSWPGKNDMRSIVRLSLPCIDHWLIVPDCPRLTVVSEPEVALFRGGFIETIKTSYASWSIRDAALLRKHPVKDVFLTTEPELRLRRSGPGSGFTLYGGLDGIEYEIPTIASRRERLYSYFSQRWKGITFHLPFSPDDYENEQVRTIAQQSQAWD